MYRVNMDVEEVILMIQSLEQSQHLPHRPTVHGQHEDHAYGSLGLGQIIHQVCVSVRLS